MLRARPPLALELGVELMHRVLTENPGRAFAVEWRWARERTASAAELVQVL
ncbi:hypothetical protein ACFY4I_38225 [Streptomyces scabiei]|uniref:hypothetical protein n=1 Tax=Streptomyces scabiei TaxID=1930 RepID=UPI0036B5EFD7